MKNVPPLTPATKSKVEKILERALQDVEFREALLNKPDEALKDSDLTPEERQIVGTMKRVQLEEWGVDMKAFRAIARDNGAKLST